MTKAASRKALAALLAIEDGGDQAGPAEEVLPTLNERVELFLRAVHGSSREFTAHERAVARSRILDAMADAPAGGINALSGDAIEDIATAAKARPALLTTRSAHQSESLSNRITRLLGPLFFPLRLGGPQMRFVIASLAVVMLAGAGWAGAWVYSARATEFAIAQWADREAQSGRTYKCGSQSLGGFPSQIEMHCTEPSVKIASDQSTVTANAKEIRAVASILQPDNLNVEITGPVAVSERNQPKFLANWTSAHLTLNGRPTNPERVSMTLDGPQFYRVEQISMQPLLTGTTIEAEVHPSASGKFEISGHIVDGFAPSVDALASQPFQAEVTAAVSGVGDSSPKPFVALLRQWRTNGGRLEVKTARVRQGDAVADAQGDIGLNDTGQIQGALRIAMAGSFVQFAEKLMQDAQAAANRDKIAQSIQTNPQIQTRSIENPEEQHRGAENAPLAPSVVTTTPGRTSSNLSIHIVDGAAYVGTVLVGTIPPLY